MRTTALAICMLLAAGCASTTRATDVAGLEDNDGMSFVHQSTSLVGLELIFGLGPSLGRAASIENAVAEFTHVAQEAGATQVRIVQSDRTTYWWVLPPLSFILTPVTAAVAGDTR